MKSKEGRKRGIKLDRCGPPLELAKLSHPEPLFLKKLF